MKNNFKQVPFWLIAISLLIGLTLPVLIQDGMFMDGELYTCVSHNLSLGIGTFWFPQFSYNNMAGLSSFHEQPPLVFGIQAVFFKLLGSSMYVERFYTFLTLCITALLIVVLWRVIFKNDVKLKQLAWLPLIVWITIPVVFWSYSNNMQENTMGIFTLCAVILIFKAFESSVFIIPRLLLAALFIFLATLSKGIPGFFPIVVPFVYSITYKKIKTLKMVSATSILLLVPLLIYAILLYFPDSGGSLKLYFFNRVILRIHDSPTVTNRFYTIYSLVSELLLQLILLGIFIFIGFRKKIKTIKNEFTAPAILFIAVGLAGTLPLMLTLVQKGFYYTPALPFFAIGFSILMAPVINDIVERMNSATKLFKIFAVVSSLFMGMALFFSFYQMGKISRDKDTLKDVHAITKVVPGFSIIGIPKDLWEDWSLQCYLMRYANISLDAGGKNYEFYLANRSLNRDSVYNYKQVNIGTAKYELYRKK